MKDRKQIGLAKIKEHYAAGEKEGVAYYEAESAPFFFVGHHLDEIEDDYWTSKFGSASPAPEAILDSLIVVNNWSYEDDGDMNVFDFSLPGDITDYVLAVVFDKNGEVEDIMMES